MTRKEALEEIQSHVYEYDKEIVNYAVSKLELTKEEFQEICDLERKVYGLSHLFCIDPDAEITY